MKGRDRQYLHFCTSKSRNLNASEQAVAGAQFTRFTSTKVQILTPEARTSTATAVGDQAGAAAADDDAEAEAGALALDDLGGTLYECAP